MSAPADPKRFKEAVEWFRRRVPITDKQLAALEASARAKAFWVAGIAQLDVVNDVWAAIDDAIEKGTTLEDFKKTVGDKLERAWKGTVKDPPRRIETIFRTNVQTAYSAGRHAQLTEPSILRTRPYWRLVVTLDSRTTETICKPLAGTVLPAESGWWKTHTPPLHFRCRSFIQALRKEDAEARGITASPPVQKPQEGFGSLDVWKPDLSKYPEPLAEVFRGR